MRDITPVGNELGTQNLSPGQIIDERDPYSQSFNNPMVRNENLLFDEDYGDYSGWTVLTSGYENTNLKEQHPYDYGKDITVQANWRYRVLTNVWVCGTQQQQEQATSDLRSHVHVSGGKTDDPNNSYSYFKPQGEAARFTLSQIQPDRRIFVNNQLYYFIGWSSQEPSVYQPTLQNFQWDQSDSNFTYQCNNIDFGNTGTQFLKEEWAAFLIGDKLDITVKTNISDPNFYQNLSFIYRLNPYGGTINRFNWTANLNPNDFGKWFQCTIPTESLGYDGYEFKGWVLGDYNDTQQEPGSGWTYWRNTTTPQLWTVCPQIVLTAVYLPGQQYTITYHSGLPGLP